MLPSGFTTSLLGFCCNQTDAAPGQRRPETLEPFDRNAMAGAAQLIGHPGIQQQAINHRAVVHGPLQILGLPNAECFPEEEIGIRIEDDVLVTSDGYELLSGMLPRHADAVEAAMAESPRQLRPGF